MASEMNSEINVFINKYVKEIRNNNAAFFAGAGFSKESGYVDWKTLLEFIASELGIEVEKEHYLVALAQYCYNKHQNRGIINDVIFEAKRRNHLFLEDLKRYRISAFMIDDFSEITEILQEIERRLNQNNIFISGCAEEYGVFTKEEAEDLIKLLSARLIQDEFNTISGFVKKDLLQLLFRNTITL